MVARTLRSTLTVAEVTEKWPATAIVFAAHGMACVGCAMARFDTLADAATAYRRDLGALLEQLAALAVVPIRSGTASRRRGRPADGRQRSFTGGET